MPRFPLYGWIGLAIMLVSEAGVLLRVEPFWSWHTPIAWTGFILFADAVIYARRGDSWLMSARAELAFLTAVSLPLWLIFEWYNAFFIHNWYYINLPEKTALRYFGYVWSYCTIWPAIFEGAELLGVVRTHPRDGGSSDLPTTGGLKASRDERGAASRYRRNDVILMTIGAAFLMWPIVRPSPYLAAPTFLGFVLLLDPINARAGDESLLSDWRAGSTRRLVDLTLSGFLCGALWEFWNYWSRAKWIYTVPILPEVKVFEMPILGFFGFPPFALECFTMYVAVRRLIRGRRGRRIGL